MTAAVLCIGTEITRGEIVNTNGAWLAAKLTEIGFEVTELVEVDDERSRVVSTLQRLAAVHDIVACTGGLGPTTDDLTAECAALAAGLPLVRDPGSVSAIEDRFRVLRRTMVASNVRQADFPSGAHVLANAVGTAPGFSVRMGRALTFFFPGVPAEMMRIWEDHCVKLLRGLAPRNTFQLRLRTFGQPESAVGQILDGVEERHPGVTLGYRASFPEIEVKVFARGSSLDQAQQRVAAARAEVVRRLGSIVYAEGDETMVGAVASLLRARASTLAIAESCTGGLLAHLVTAEPASDYLIAALVTYSNEAKTALLGVPRDLIQAHGAVSEQVAIAMARCVMKQIGADYGLAVTGIAGPTGATPEKPVGLVYWAVAYRDRFEARNRVFAGDRARVQRAAAFAALDLLRQVLLRPVPTPCSA